MTDERTFDWRPAAPPAPPAGPGATRRVAESPFDRLSIRDKDERWPDIAGTPIRMVSAPTGSES